MAMDMFTTIGHILVKRGFSEKTAELLRKCRAAGTLKNKFYKWRQWAKFALDAQICTLNFKSPEGVNFLTQLALQQNVGPGPCKQMKETFTFVHKFCTDTLNIMSLVVDAAFREKPTKPRRVHAFNVEKVFDYLHDLGPCDTLSYHELRDRALVLFVMDMFCQRQCASNLFKEVVVINFGSPPSGNAQDDILSVSVRLFRGKNYRPGNSDWSPVYTIRAAQYKGEYFCSTPHNFAALIERRKTEEKFDFDGFFPPITMKKTKSNTLLPATVASILGTVLENAEISGFTPGDFRAATSSACYRAGVPIRRILDRGGWKGESTFFMWYRKLSDIDPTKICEDLMVEDALRGQKLATCK